ncbi:magnesium transporter CorA family protein [Paenibacillus lemnae]|uniref:Magnesium transporter n=1 Tax=Paenibacillus lemnae TaxID=1330551 RepID=A0A848M8C2_PAELE|nr:magnesium transporter CorA family protein [Paenibacillus lemnae]NMO97287.1 magnesium transporter [Paenibacillus lemnae]
MEALNREKGQLEHKMDGGWTWYDLQTENWDEPVIKELEDRFPEFSEWLGVATTLKGKNHLSVRMPDGINPVMLGTIMYTIASDLDEDRENEQFYFYIDTDALITFNLDDETREMMREPDRVSMLNQCQQPIEGMFVLTRAILYYFHAGMDQFETRLREVESAMRKHNERHLLDRILTSRFELLYWNNLFIPFQELIAGSKEGYLDQIKDSRYYQQLLHRVERMETLFRHYHREIDTLISIDDAVHGFRGNEIMKTLTIFTVIVTPLTVVGAIWGMNFELLPITKPGWGFTVVMLLTILLTGGLYFWMYRKGWTGDLLKVRSKDKNI